MSQRAFPRLLAGLVLLSAACSQPSAQPTTAPAAGTSLTAPGPTSSPAPTAIGQPVASRSVPGAAAASASASPSAAPAAAAGTVRLTIASDQSEARFIAREQLAANTIQTDAIGSTKDVSGQIIVQPDGRMGDGSKITVGVQSLTSDRSQRDSFIKRNTLQTDRFPNADFAPTEAQGLAWPLPATAQAHFSLLGDMTVHGVTKPVTWDVDATFSDSDVTGKASTVVRLDTFGMSKPQVAIVASIADDIRLELDFTAARSSE